MTEWEREDGYRIGSGEPAGKPLPAMYLDV